MNETNQQIIDYLMHSQGINITMYDNAFLEKSIQNRRVGTQCSSAEAYETFMMQNIEESTIFLNSLQISYTEFFRNPLTCSVLERIILPEIIFSKKNKKSKEIRIWSAACAGGHETYSLAMLIEGLNIGKQKNGYRIFGTDKDEAQINKARLGEYNAESVGNVSRKHIKKWFMRSGNTVTVVPELKKYIEFSVFDLFSEQYSSPPTSIFGDFDIVICANLLFYYKAEYQKIILEKVGNSLAKGGYLIVGETEREILMNYGYRELYQQSGIFIK